MRFKDRQQIFVHERFASQDAKEAIAHLFGLGDRAIDRVEFDPRLLGSHVDPTALAAQIAAIDHRQIKKRRKNSPRLRRRLCLWTLFNPPQPNVHIAFPQQSFVGFQKQAASQCADTFVVTLVTLMEPIGRRGLKEDA